MNRTGTPGSWAPEQIVRQALTRVFMLTPATDVWCFGVMLLESFSPKSLDEYPQALQDIVYRVQCDAVHVANSGPGSDALRGSCGKRMRDFFLTHHCGTPVDYIAQKCLEPVPKDRPTMQEVLSMLKEFVPTLE